MAAVQAVKPVITPFDRLGLTLILAVLVHALIMLGTVFVHEDRPRTRFNTMEIVLVQQKSPEPEAADLLAQANLEGGGEVEEVIHPAALPAPFPSSELQITTPPPINAEPPQSPEPAAIEVEVLEPEPIKQEIVEKIAIEDTMSNDPNVEKVDTPSKEKKSAETKEVKTTSTKSTPEKEKTQVKKTTQKSKPPSATELLTNSFKIASLSAEIKRKMEVKAQRPKKKFISATTKEFKYAAYMDSWRSKIERIGNLNYPEQARQQKLSGNLILEVALNADGSINAITIRRSSGEKILDDAAVRIVKLAAPYAPFPQHIKDEIDILHIMRTWQFINSKGFL